MYTIFINESVIYLSEEPHKSPDVTSKKYKGENFIDVIEKLSLGCVKKWCYYKKNLGKLWEIFRSHFIIIEAAGGLVFNEQEETLWIYRNGRWDLPKGKIEPGEFKDKAAVREVEEECGVTILDLMCPILDTYHIYKHKNNYVLKVTYWYKMIASSNDFLVPQIEEGITEVAWIDTVKKKEILENTYGNIKLICKFAFLN